MISKKCKKCEQLKPLELFRVRKDTKDGYGVTCKECEALVNKIYRERNSDVIKLKRDENKEALSVYFKRRYNDNFETISNYHKERYELIKKDKLEYDRNYRMINKDKISNRRKEYYKNNKERLIKNSINYKEIRKKSDPIFRLKINIKNCIGSSIRNKGFIKKSRLHEILGCSIPEFKEYLESKFQSWMTWDNYGLYNGEANFGWDIDHIVPSSSAINEVEIIKLNHFSNLQPLCSFINRNIKKNKY